MANDDSKKYGVGRGKPPTWTQFRKGRSGNPKGRPKKNVLPPPMQAESRSDDILRELLAGKVKIRDAKGERHITSQEAVRQAQLKSALAGSPISQRDLLRESQELEARDAERAQLQLELEKSLFEAAVRWRADRQSVWAAAEEQGVEPEDPWPHSDDILINKAEQTWRVRGPFNADEILRFEYLQAERDAHFAKAMIELRTCKMADCGKPSIADFLWRLFDTMLPLRWQIAPREDWFVLKCLSVPLRKLRETDSLATQRAKELRVLASIPDRDSETYHMVNKMMRPIVLELGYKSLAHFEHAYEKGLCERTVSPSRE